MSNLLENQKERIEWYSSDAHRELCALKGKQDMDCQNYIRVYARLPDNRIMICGTNSYKPLCRIYAKHMDDASGKISTTTEMVNELEAQGRCPYNPTHNSTYVYTGTFAFQKFCMVKIYLSQNWSDYYNNLCIFA